MGRHSFCAPTTGRNSWRPPSCAGCKPRRLGTAFIDPGKPWQNGADESFNGKFRDQHPSLQWLRNRADAKVSIEAWRRRFNEVRPHSSLWYLTPAAFEAKHLADGAGGRSSAKPACADMTKNGAPRVDTASEQLAPLSE